MSAQARRHHRIRAGIATVAVEGLLAYVLISGLAIAGPARVSQELKVFDVMATRAPPPVERPVRPRAASHAQAHIASAPAPESKPAEPIAPAVLATTQPASDGGLSAGAALAAGSGSANDGRGAGTASGGAGNGDGDGLTLPRWRSGRVKDSDYPRDAWEAGIGGTVSVRYVVATSGRATGCQVVHSSGNASLDVTTCQLIERRFRFDPSRDARGRAVPSIVSEDHDWSAT